MKADEAFAAPGRRDRHGRIGDAADLALARGPQQSLGGLAVRPAGPHRLRRVRPAAARADRPVLDAALERHRAVHVRRPRQLRQDPHRPRPRRGHPQRLQAHLLLQRRARRPRPARRVAHPARRDRAARHGVADGALPAPGHPARRGRHHVELAALEDRPRQPGPDGRSASAASRAPGSRTSAWRCPRSASSAPGCCSASARSCC